MASYRMPAPSSVAHEAASSGFMSRVYRWMAGGLALTGLVSAAVVSSPDALQLIYGQRWVFYGLVIAELVMVLAFSRVARTASFGASAAMFLAYCAMSGVTFSVYLLAYTHESVATTFFITGGTFLGMSAFGTLTKRNLSSWRQFLMMGLFGMVIAIVVNIFIGSSAMGFVISCVGVVVFTGLTAYDTQRLMAMGGFGDNRMALQGALMLYLDFVNLFISLLNLTGRRR